MSDKTHFGFEQVDVKDKARKVAEVFHSVADKYDIMNDLMSMGVHRLWKKVAIEMTGLRPGQSALDLAGGTGDLSMKMARLVGPQGTVILSDINESMLRNGRDRLLNHGIGGNVHYGLVNAEAIPFADNTFDCITISFGLRNVTHKDKALAEMYRVLKPGGRALVLEFSKPQNDLFSKVYDFYSFKALPFMGKLVANDEASYRYLAESIRMHPDQETLRQMMCDAGFDECDYHNMTNGVVAIHRGFKY